MKYELLGLFHKHFLIEIKKYSKQTAKTYLSKMDGLLDGQNFFDIMGSFNMDKVLVNLSKIKHKNPFSQAKNALILFCEFQNIPISNHHLDEIAKLEEKTKRKYRKLKPVIFKKVDGTIKRLRNTKLKLSYQTLLYTGLRVSELAQITPSDCLITDDEIHISFIGKGRNKASAVITKADDEPFFTRLIQLINNTEAISENKKIFCSANYLQTNAKKYGFNCHDLRRIYAKREYNKTKSKTHVMEKLRHTSLKSTKIYLRSKVKI